jgi:hypothetical protein
MKKYIIFAIIAIALAGTIIGLWARVSYLLNERNVYKGNTTALLDTLKHYKVNDSLNVVSVQQLQLTLGEYKRFRAEDYALIEKLQVDKSRLEQVTKTQTKTAYTVQGEAQERIVYRDSVVIDTVRCYTYNDRWLYFDGCIDGSNQFAGEIVSKDSLLYTEHIVPKRFLGFLWKYGVRERRQEIVSLNPHTEIVGAEFLTIRE